MSVRANRTSLAFDIESASPVPDGPKIVALHHGQASTARTSSQS